MYTHLCTAEVGIVNYLERRSVLLKRPYLYCTHTSSSVMLGLHYVFLGKLCQYQEFHA